LQHAGHTRVENFFHFLISQKLIFYFRRSGTLSRAALLPCAAAWGERFPSINKRANFFLLR